MPLLSISGLTKNYGEKQALQDISFSVQQGEIVGLIGKNGAGKTTILKSIGNMLGYSAGSIRYQGQEIARNPQVTREFGILIECAFLDYVNAYDNMRILGMADDRYHGRDLEQRIDDALRLVGLYDVRKKKVKAYSFGMKQRLGLAQAIMSAEGFLMLDEPFIGLDPLGKEVVKDAILQKAKGGFGILFSSHDLPDVAEICDRVVMINEGKCLYEGAEHKTEICSFVLQEPMTEEQMQMLSEMDLVKVAPTQIVCQQNAAALNALLQFFFAQGLMVDRISSENQTLLQMFSKEAV